MMRDYLSDEKGDSGREIRKATVFFISHLSADYDGTRKPGDLIYFY